jgi:hypothetical protein
MTRPTASPAGTIARMDSAALRLIIEGKTIKFFIRLLTKEDRLEERVVAGRRRAVTAQTAAAERSGEREKKERRERRRMKVLNFPASIGLDWQKHTAQDSWPASQ